MGAFVIMKEFIKNHKFGISLISALFVGVVIIHFSGGCPIYRIFHIECLGCGMTHALLAALKLDFRTAVHYHPMFWSVPIIAALVLFEGKIFKKRILNIIVISVICVGFVLQYILKYKGIV